MKPTSPLQENLSEFGHDAVACNELQAYSFMFKNPALSRRPFAAMSALLALIVVAGAFGAG